MKKTLLIIAVIAVLSGCGNTTDTLTCTASNTVGTFTSNTTYLVEYSGNDVKKLTVTYGYNEAHVDGVGTGTDGTTEDDDMDTNDGIIDGVVGDALDDVVTGIADGILDMSGIKDMHNNRFGSYANTNGFTSNVDTDTDNNYRVTYTYDLDVLSDTDVTNFGFSRDLDTLKAGYTNRGLTCK